jgi:DeoR/GlpR family transcriptional regulator of sugar metabolism
MRAYAVRLLRLRRIEFSVHTGRESAGGTSRDGEIADYTCAEAEQRARIIEAAARAYLTTQKFGRLAPIRFSAFPDRHQRQVDVSPPAQTLENLLKKGLKIIVARE